MLNKFRIKSAIPIRQQHSKDEDIIQYKKQFDLISKINRQRKEWV